MQKANATSASVEDLNSYELSISVFRDFPLIVEIEDLQVCTWFSKVENFRVDVSMRMTFINCGIQGKITLKRKPMPLGHSQSQTLSSSNCPERKAYMLSELQQDDTEDNNDFIKVAGVITLPVETESARTLTTYGSGLVTTVKAYQTFDAKLTKNRSTDKKCTTSLRNFYSYHRVFDKTSFITQVYENQTPKQIA